MQKIKNNQDEEQDCDIKSRSFTPKCYPTNIDLMIYCNFYQNPNFDDLFVVFGEGMDKTVLKFIDIRSVYGRKSIMKKEKL